MDRPLNEKEVRAMFAAQDKADADRLARQIERELAEAEAQEPCPVCGKPAPFHEKYRRALHEACVGEYLFGE